MSTNNKNKVIIILAILIFSFVLNIYTKEHNNQSKEPKIHTNEKPEVKIKRGSKKEIEEFKKHHLSVPKTTKPKKTIKKQKEVPKLPHQEKPIKIKKHKKDINLHKSIPKPQKKKKISHPSKFKTKYNLKGAAEIAVNIIDSNFYPVNTFIITQQDGKGKTGTKKGPNEIILWDGKDINGNVAPPGTYYACISVVYKNGKKETFGVELIKE